MVKPQCIVQGLGVVLNHAKEGALHWDLRSGERSLWYTTTGWMMWNWLLGASCPPSAYAWLSSEKPNVGLYLDERWHGPQQVLQRGNPWMSVYKADLQSTGLGSDVTVHNDAGVKPVEVNTKKELA